MNSCTIPNFDKNKELKINIAIEDNGDIDSLYKRIDEWMENNNKLFAMKREESNDEENWNSSMNDFFDKLNNELGTSETVRTVIEKLRKKYLIEDVQGSPESSEIPLEIPDAGLPKKETKNERKLRDDLKEFFSGDSLLIQDFQEEFKHSIFGLTIVQVGNDVESSNIVTDVESINIGIIKFLNKEYHKIYSFLEEQGENLEEIDPDMFVLDKKSDKYGKKNQYTKLLDLFYKHLKQYDDLPKFLSENFEQKYQNKDCKLLNATYAYLNIKYFQDILLKNYGKYFYIDRKATQIIDEDDNGNKKYKYGINRRNSQLSAGWETNAIRDGIKELGPYSIMIMEQIPLLNSIGYLSKNDVVISLLKLQRGIENGNNIELKKALRKTYYNLIEGWKEVLKITHRLITENSVQDLIKSSSLNILDSDKTTQKGSQLTEVDLQNINSIYSYFFNKKSGLYYIQRQNTFNKGLSRNYDLVSSVFGSVKSTTQANYLEVVYDRTNKKNVIRIKSKNNQYNDVHNLKRNIENACIQDEEKCLGFNLNVASGDVGFGNFIIQFDNDTEYGIFNVNSKIKKINGIGEYNSLDQYFRSQIDKLHSVSSIENLLASEDTKDKEFISLLEFIDSQLTTDFSYGVLGLQTLRTLKLVRSTVNKGGDVLQKLYLYALRAASAKTLNVELKNNPDKTLDSIEYITKSNKFPPYKFLKKLDSKSSTTLSSLRLYDDEYWFRGIQNDNATNDFFDDIIKAKNIINRQDTKSVTKNVEKNNVSNVSVFFTNIIHEFQEQGDDPSSNKDIKQFITKHLLFSGSHSNAILATSIDLDLETQYKEIKTVDQYSTSELFYHSFVNKFIIPMQENIFIAQPVTYSDKKKFLNFPISISSIYKNNVFKEPEQSHLTRMNQTMGEYYRDLFKKIVNDYRLLFGLGDNYTDREVFVIANKKMKDYSEQQLISLASSVNIKLYKDLHYRNLNKKTCANETLLYYMDNIYGYDKNDNTKLAKFLNGEKAKYITNLLGAYTLIKVDNNIKSVFKKTGYDIDNWIDKDGYLVLGKQTTNGRYFRDLKFGDKISEQDISSGKVKLNPLLNTYFYVSNLINNNLKLGLVGHELHHLVKQLPKLTKNLKDELGVIEGDTIIELQENISEYEKNQLSDLAMLTINPQTGEELDNFEKVTLNVEGNLQEFTVEQIRQEIAKRKVEINKLKEAVNSTLYSILSLAQNAQFKRTVAIPGTIRPYDQGKLDGILPTYNVAFIDDVKAFVHDYKGNYGWDKDEDIKSHDGSAWIDPFTSIHENNSLDESEVGEVKKPLWDVDDPIYGARTLVKYALNTITNALMLKSMRSNLSLYNMFKKMTDSMKWNGTIDLVNDWAIVPYDKTAFSKYIINDENPLFYSIGSSYRKIINFGKDEESGIYYTDEVDVGVLGHERNQDVHRVYHLFEKGTSRHIRTESIPEGWNQNYTKIDSLFQLHSALGGIYSCSLVDGRLIHSEASNKAVAQFMNYVTKRKPGLQERFDKSKARKKNNNTGNILASSTQQDFDQPLKRMLINCIVNDSAVKNGSSNTNPSSSYYDDTPLRYVTLSTLKYGIQQDSDHDADEAELTEMTQVISALDATGLYHDEVYDIYYAIGDQIVNSLQLEMEALSTTDRNKLYDLIGKTIINNFTDRKGMVKAILNQLENTFNLTTNHDLDKTLCPFSDATLYNKILQTLGSIINKKAIKRKYPGSGMVMVPAYDIYQLWDIDGQVLQYEDVLKQAIQYNKSLKKKGIKFEQDLEDYNKKLVDAYLDYKLPDQEIFTLSQDTTLEDLKKSLDITPESVVIVNYTLLGEDKSTDPIKLNSVRDYYEFKFHTEEFLKNYLKTDQNVIINNIIKTRKIPRNLSDTKTEFSYKDNLGNINKLNIFDSQVYKRLYEAKRIGDRESELKWGKRIKTFLANLENNIYTRWENDVEQQYPIVQKSTTLAETVMSNVFRTTFGIKEGDSLYDILQEGPKYFRPSIRPLDGQTYNFDIQLITGNGENVYISLDKEDDNSSYDTRTIKWDRSHMNKVRISDKERFNSKVINRVYLMDDNNMNMFEIGREIDVSSSVIYDKSKNKFFDKVTKEEIKDRNLFLDGDIVVEYFEFVTKNKIVPENDVSFTRYNINQKNLEAVLLPKEQLENNRLLTKEEALNQRISSIIYGLYKSDSFLTIQPSSNVLGSHYFQIRNIFRILRDTDNNENFKNYCNNILENVFTFPETNISKSQYIQLNSGKQLMLLSNQTLRKFGLYEKLKKEKINKVISELTRLANLTEDEKLRSEIRELLLNYNKTKLEYWNDEFINQHIKEKYVSFQKSLKFISSRIPAQTLQSFMAMKCVGFTGVDASHAAVTHFQTFLQGSDYDIDKSYMMGLNFDGNGIYYKWSDLFDFTSLETLEASEQLPLSRGYEYLISSEQGLNVTELCMNILNSKEHSVERILNIVKLLKYIYHHTDRNINEPVRLLVGLDNKSISKIRKILEIHEDTIIPLASRDATLKNFISSNIQRISNSLGNLDEAYTPVEMNDLRSSAEDTPKSKLAQSLTLFNPTMINIMQFQNMSGKQVTGIAANGQKALFMWRTGTLEALNKNKDLDMITFNLSLQGIKDRSKYKESEYGIINILPNAEISILPDLDATSNKVFYDRAKKLFPKISSDNIGSQYISAATDNAKELILACINAGNKMAKCHLYLMSLGFDVEDIVRFMTCDAVSFIDKITDPNIFARFNLDINYAISWAINYVESLTEQRDVSDLKGVPSVLMEAFKEELNKLKRVPEQQRIRFKNDLETLKKVLAGANEFSSFGRILGINQGIPQTKEDLMSWKNNLKNIIKNAEKKLQDPKTKRITEETKLKYGIKDSKYDEVRGSKFSADEWLKNPEYRKLTMEYYNKIKESLNIFYFIENIPHFKEMFKGVYIVNEVDSRISLKGKLVNEFSAKLREKYPYAPKNYEKKFEVIFNELFIESFVKDMNFTVKLDKSWRIFDKNYNLNVGNKSKMKLNDDSSLSSFKYIFENYIIPQLKNKTLDVQNGQEMYNDPDIKEFLNGLVLSEDNEVPFYKANLNMTLKDIDSSTRLKYSKFLRGIKALQKYKWGEHSISDLFVLYNLIVNKNQYGSERLTELFEDFVTDFENRKGQKESLLMKYLRYLGKQDYYNYILEEMRNNVTLTDLLRKAAPIVSENSINKVKRSDPIVMAFTRTGIQYYENVGYSEYKPLEKTLVEVNGETKKEFNHRQRLQYKYSFGLPYINYINTLTALLKSNKNHDIENSLDELIKNNTIEYTVKCDGM